MKNKKFLLQLGCIFLVMFMVLVVGCSSNGNNEPNNNNNEPGQPSDQNNDEPVLGGTLRIIRPAGPAVLSYYPEMGPTDSAAVFPAAEMLVAPNADREYEPQLAKTFVEDPDANTITFTLHEGVKFHDGTEMTADVVKWNYETFKEKLQFNDLLEDIEVVNKYTLVFHLKEWHNQILPSWGSAPIFSQEAYEKNGGKEWARQNIVGTGPFELEEFQRDVKMTWVKFEDYWREGQPYLDRVEITYISEATTAQALMLAGEADIWLEAPVQNMSELEEQGFTRQAGWAGMYYHLMPNTVDPDSPFADVRVREALEYAINKEALCEALGYGYYEPLNRVAPAGEWGGSDEPFRPYDPDKAKELLADAGYADGLKMTLLAPIATGGRNEGAEAIASYLEKAGFDVELDIADVGRFYAAVFGNGWEDVALMFSGPDMTYLISAHRWWGPYPMTNLASLGRPDEFSALFDESLTLRTVEEQKAITEEIVNYMGENAMVIPLFNNPGAFIHNGKVHTTYYQQGFARWDYYDMWLEQD